MAARIIVDNARGFVGLLRDHIMKEEEVLLPMADCVLGPEVQRELDEKFEQFETTAMGPGVHERYQRLLEELESELGVASG